MEVPFRSSAMRSRACRGTQPPGSNSREDV
jgi:hypothetical protein